MYVERLLCIGSKGGSCIGLAGGMLACTGRSAQCVAEGAWMWKLKRSWVIELSPAVQRVALFFVKGGACWAVGVYNV